MIDVVLDLETMGRGHHAAIIEIGAVAFDRSTLELIPAENGGEFSALITLDSVVKTGGTLTPDTIMWWMQQSDAARSRFADAVMPHNQALWRFKNWLSLLASGCAGIDGTLNGIWGNGAVFDNVILASAFEREGIPVPWTYKQDRCYRTMRAEFSHIEQDEWIGIYHSGVDDARNEANHLIKILKEIRA